MARSIRANVPVQLGPFTSIRVTMTGAVEPDGGGVHHYCVGAEGSEHSPARIKATQQCPQCERVGWDWRKGQEVADGQVVLLDRAEQEALVDPATKDALLVSAHPLREVLAATVPGDTVYYLEPAKAGKSSPVDARGYRLLHELLRRNPSKAVLAVFTARSKPKLWRLQVVGEVITMQSLCWPEDLRSAPVVPVAEVDREHFTLAQRLLRSVFRPFDVGEFRDATRRQTAVGEPVGVPTQAPASLVDALRASVESVQAERKADKRSA